jgi:hypothetical protein
MNAMPEAPLHAIEMANRATEAIDVSRFPLRIFLKVVATVQGYDFAIGIIAAERDGNDPKPEKFATKNNISHEVVEQFAMGVSCYAEDPDAAILGVLVERSLEFVRQVVLHELDECTYVRGVRIYDPHTKRRRRDAHP